MTVQSVEPAVHDASPSTFQQRLEQETLQMHRANAGAVEQSLGETVGVCTDDDAVRRRLGLQARRQVRRLPDGLDLRVIRPRR